VGLVVAVALVGWPHLRGHAGAAIAAAALVVALAGQSAYALATAATTHGGAIPSAGPSGLAIGAGGPRRGGVGLAPGQGPPGGGFGGGGPGGGAGGLLGGSTPSAALVSVLEQDATRYTWVAATVRAEHAAGYQLATGDPVM